MKFSYNWIGELVEGLDTDAEALARLITMKTAESEGVEAYGAHLAHIRAARVKSVEPIADSKNVKAVVDAGPLGERTVVCGAPNCRAGIVTAYVPAGTSLGGRDIRKAAISGVESDGMLASGAELGLNRDAAGVLELDLNPGDSLGCTPDAIIEIDNKSITHRPDLWGHLGMAREVAAITGRPLRDPVKRGMVAGEPAIGVSIEDFELCPRYSALVFENVTVQPSPLWLQYRLEAVGLNPITNIVDVTNYVMAELAQPMHAFDADKLRGGIKVRRAHLGESFTALNDVRYELNRSNLVIADQGGAIALAGVIGGLDSAIGPGTTRIVLESANFQASSIRKTSSALKLRTDASMRFEKAQDPVNTVRGLRRAMDLLQQVSPGIRLTGGLADVFRPLPPMPQIELPLEWLNRKLGRELAPAEVRGILESLQFQVEEVASGVLRVGVPSWRATKDVSIKDDLVEEVGRMIGYASIPPSAPAVPVVPPHRNEQRIYHQAVRRMTAAQGFHEVYNYSFISEELARQFGAAAGPAVTNPIAAGQELMRSSLIPGIWRNVVENSKYSDVCRLFEIGREIHKGPAGELPEEVNHLAAAMYRKDGDGEHLFELKRLAECLAPDAELMPCVAQAFEHPARTAEVLVRGEKVGRLFEFHPSLVKGRGAVLDLNLDLLQRLTTGDRRYRPVRRYPSSAFDLSVIAGQRVLVGDLRRMLFDFAGEGVDSIEFVREYSGPPLAEGTKSVSFRLTVAALDHTLSSEEVGARRAAIIEGMQSRGFELRV